MRRTNKIDPFFDKQPPLTFVEELKEPLHKEKPKYYGTRKREEREVDVKGLYLANQFGNDPDNLLETIYIDFQKFLRIYEIDGNKFPIFLEHGETDCFEAYKIIISKDNIRIIANDTEGIRRGIIYIEDELRRREGAFLEEGEIHRKPFIKTRITRCFFSPINRFPKWGDELSDDIDYYPEEYLNRLMHDGANGLWIYTRFSDLVPSSIIKEYGNGYEKRIAKLNRTIEKCARYGIGVYVFAIEPIALTPELLEKYPQLAGTVYDVKGDDGVFRKGATFCTNSEEGKKFLYEIGVRLLELAPKLTGFISITQGERISSCASYPEGKCTCPICSGKKRGHVLSDTVEALCSGFRAKNPDFKVVSWSYGHRSWEFEQICDYVETAPSDAFLMQNFEEMGYEEQLGKMRQCVDYWLSYVGPSELFKVTAEKAMETHKHMFAKLQVCCSHEIASVPYVPVPGILYKKYAAAKALNVEGIVQCWYFGNYPSLMSKAAGELAFVDSFDDEEGFLKNLAGIYWGRNKAEKISHVWKEFEKGYAQYPMNIMYSYYGPMHDSVVWKLALKPKNFSLPRTWFSLDCSDGDRIGECMLNGHTIEEVLTLVENMKNEWHKGVLMLAELSAECAEEMEQISIAKTIDILFESAYHIILFYYLREKLGLGKGDAKQILGRLRELVHAEIKNSCSIITLCKEDSKLGYHSEAEGFKFFPAKLEDRIKYLEDLLLTEFKEVETRIDNGLVPLEYYEGIEDNPDIKRYNMGKGNIDHAQWEVIDAENNTKFRMSYDEDNIYLEMSDKRKEAFILSPEFRLLWPNADIMFLPDGSVSLTYDGKMYFGLFKEKADAELKKYQNIKVIEDEGTHLLVTIKRSDVGHEEIRPMKMKLVCNKSFWCKEENPTNTLGKSSVSPGDYGWILPV